MDALGYRKKIGIVVPSTNTVVGPECEALRPRGVTNHVARLTLENKPIEASEAGFLAHMQRMRDGIFPAIDQVMTCAPDHVIMSVAIEAFTGGVAAAAALQDELAKRAGVGVSMGSTAATAALNAFGAKRIAVLTPHQPKGDEIVAGYLKEAGFEVVRLVGLRCASPFAIAEVQPPALRKLLREIDGDDIDAILQVGTNLANAAVAAEAERWLAKPVLAMNVVTYWDALRRCGIDDRLFGFGRVLEEL
ncbi:Asp/Glu racemase [Rhodoplanes sp. TEM]|uniref:Asp/Glu racemase n=1 Tax=Rhodoplanes tepidamans TaxID=200616 RepID=A0ABT5JCU3_RHOTP|nr:MULTISPECIES: Asp/Glu racemase [Rhodoplanes]MDC7787437.1 Asp/Glu racemase [Rhodoplanes tepidamans]MDC7986346.1 Asp/Glu racemase [Rhodoplanes sp. TEM]MDQ0358077.1 maleate isomerase [Rhodoplanes tepidamans]